MSRSIADVSNEVQKIHNKLCGGSCSRCIAGSKYTFKRPIDLLETNLCAGISYFLNVISFGRGSLNMERVKKGAEAAKKYREAYCGVMKNNCDKCHIREKICPATKKLEEHLNYVIEELGSDNNG